MSLKRMLEVIMVIQSLDFTVRLDLAQTGLGLGLSYVLITKRPEESSWLAPEA